ncbi:DUF4145 domain-containing protein [Leptospira stimsonii]|uniref:DUF4145 domain-containing protein n=1 Tax=Leptospira stimsonii TaxID=2202203 RepID=A0A396Z4G5_9LEPT|nr:DUF4145 domain-containing protein [Leptospira stimsonii]RHX89043.1 hypothetical protein DLM75_14345 [Leptospira stimsonii]
MAQDKTGENILLMALGGLIGVAMAQPKNEEKIKLQQFNSYQEEFNHYLSLRNHFFEFLSSREKYFQFQNFLKEVRKKNLKIRVIKKSQILIKDKILQSLMREAQTAFLYDMPRATVILSSTALEYILQKKYNSVSFNEAIEKLYSEKLIRKPHYHFLHGLRSERNEHVHEAPADYNIDDAEMILNLTISLLDILL